MHFILVTGKAFYGSFDARDAAVAASGETGMSHVYSYHSSDYMCAWWKRRSAMGHVQVLSIATISIHCRDRDLLLSAHTKAGGVKSKDDNDLLERGLDAVGDFVEDKWAHCQFPKTQAAPKNDWETLPPVVTMPEPFTYVDVDALHALSEDKVMALKTQIYERETQMQALHQAAEHKQVEGAHEAVLVKRRSLIDRFNGKLAKIEGDPADCVVLRVCVCVDYLFNSKKHCSRLSIQSDPPSHECSFEYVANSAAARVVGKVLQEFGMRVARIELWFSR